jgi:hypothetical protein
MLKLISKPNQTLARKQSFIPQSTWGVEEASQDSDSLNNPPPQNNPFPASVKRGLIFVLMGIINNVITSGAALPGSISLDFQVHHSTGYHLFLRLALGEKWRRMGSIGVFGMNVPKRHW